MTNKKGISILKTILFILLCVTFIFLLIYLFNYINDSNKKITSSDRTKLIAPIDYNPVNNISSYYIYSYKNNNAPNHSNYTSDIYNYETNSLVYYLSSYDFDEHIINVSSGYYPFGFSPSISDNKLFIGRDLSNCFTLAKSNFDWNSVRSWSIGYNCDIPVESFNFTMYYNFPISSTITPYFYIYTDVGSMRFTNISFNSTSLNYSFSYSPILSTLPTATRILRFGFFFANGNSSANYSYYLPSQAGVSSLNNINYDNNNLVYNNYFNSLSDVQKDNLCYLSFSTTSYPIDYTEGYNTGYNDAIIYTNGQINSLNSTIFELQNQISNLTTTINNQSEVITWLQTQLNNSSNRSFKTLFFDMADTPLRVVSNCLGFEVFGINLFQFFIGILTTLGCIWLIKKFI